jgi:hypothetical protein
MISPREHNLPDSRDGDLARTRGGATDDVLDTEEGFDTQRLSDIDDGTIRSVETVDGDDELPDVEIMEEDEEMMEDDRVEAQRGYGGSEGSAASSGSSGTSEPRDGNYKPEELAPLFDARNARDYRARWDIVQRGFVDDPAEAVRDGDALVTEVINTLSQTYAQERSTLESELSRRSEARTEVLRCALRRDRAFLERLLAF